MMNIKITNDNKGRGQSFEGSLDYYDTSGNSVIDISIRTWGQDEQEVRENFKIAIDESIKNLQAAREGA